MASQPDAPAILVVEDEPLIAMLIEDYLDVLGYRVAAQVDCLADAIPLVNAGDFSAALLDVNLRGSEAVWPLADLLMARHIPFALTTGGDVDCVPTPYRGAPILAKPYTLDQVKAAMMQLFATASG